MRDRARQAIKEFVVPIIRDVVKEEKGDVAKEKENVNIALVSHGVCISELVAALLGLDRERRSKGQEVPDRQYAGLMNTAWTRATVDLAVGVLPLSISAIDVDGWVDDAGYRRNCAG